MTTTINHVFVLDAIAEQIRQRLFGSAADSLEPGYLTSSSICPSLEQLNDNDKYNFIKCIFKKEITICRAQFTKKYPHILPSQSFESYYACISRLPFFLYHALCCVKKDQFPPIFEKYPQLGQLAEQIRPLCRSDKLQLIQDLAFSKFANIAKLRYSFNSLFDTFLCLLPVLAYLLQNCTHELTRLQLYGILSIFLTKLHRTRNVHSQTVHQMVFYSLSPYCIFENSLLEKCTSNEYYYRETSEKLLLNFMENPLALRSRKCPLSGIVFQQFCGHFFESSSSMYNLAVSQFHQESPKYLYFSSHSEPLSYAEVLLASEYGGTVLVAFPDEARNLVLVSLPENSNLLTEQQDDASDAKLISDKLPQQVSTSSSEDPPLERTLYALGNQLVSLYCGALHLYRNMFSVAKMNELPHDYYTEHLTRYLQKKYPSFKERLNAFFEKYCQMDVLESKGKDRIDLALHYYETLFQPYSEKLKLHIELQVGKNELQRRQLHKQCEAGIKRFGEKKWEWRILEQQVVSRFMERLYDFLGRCDSYMRQLLMWVQGCANLRAQLNYIEMHQGLSEQSKRYLGFQMINHTENEIIHREANQQWNNVQQRINGIVSLLVDTKFLNLNQLLMNGSESVSCSTSERSITIQGTTFYSLVEISSIIANPPIATNTEQIKRKQLQKSANRMRKNRKAAKISEIEGNLNQDANQRNLQLQQRNLQLEEQVSQLNQLVVDLISGKPLFIIPPAENPVSALEPETSFPRTQVNSLPQETSVTNSQCNTLSQQHSLTAVNSLDTEPEVLSSIDSTIEQTTVSEATSNIDQDMLDINLDELFAELSDV